MNANAPCFCSTSRIPTSSSPLQHRWPRSPIHIPLTSTTAAMKTYTTIATATISHYATVLRSVREGMEAVLSPDPQHTLSYPDREIETETETDVVVNEVTSISLDDDETPSSGIRQRKRKDEQVDDYDNRFKLGNGREVEFAKSSLRN